MVMEYHPILNNNEKVASNIAGETTTRVMTLDGKTADDIIRENNVNKFNDRVDTYKERLDKHSASLDEFAEKLSDKILDIEIMPLGSYVLVRELEENPFQRIVKQGGIITDLGGMKPEYKNTDSGEWEEEEQFIKVGIVQEVGPETRYLREGDAVFYPKNATIPVPFYKQKLIQINETRVLAVVNEKLTERFNEIKNDK